MSQERKIRQVFYNDRTRCVEEVTEKTVNPIDLAKTKEAIGIVSDPPERVSDARTGAVEQEAAKAERPAWRYTEEELRISEEESAKERRERGEFDDYFEDKKRAEVKAAREEHHHRMEIIRSVAVCVALVFLLVLSSGLGVGLALWDLDRSPKELVALLNKEEVQAAEYEGASAESNARNALDENEYDEPIPEDRDSLSYEVEPDAEDLDVNDEQIADEGYEEEDDTPADGDEDESDVPESGEDSDESGDAEDAYGISDDSNSGDSDTDGDKETDENVGDDEMPAFFKEENERIAKALTTFQTVDEEYFADALFIGDSRLQGFGLWSELPATYYCATGFQLYKYDTFKVVQTENGKVPIFEAIPYDAFTKIYIKVGLNEMGWGTEEGFCAKYKEFIDALKATQPRAIVYVHAILPVTESKSASDRSHNNPNIIKRNEALKQFAADNGYIFVNAGPVLSDENGALKPEMTSDGVHLASKYMAIWKQYLMEHAIVTP